MRKQKILIVDDSMFMRRQIKMMIAEGEDKEIIEASNGMESIQLYQAEKPDLVLLDITMPDKSGIEVLEELLAINPKANIIMCSALGQEQMIADALRIGAKDFLVKPIKKEQLQSVLQAYHHV